MTGLVKLDGTIVNPRLGGFQEHPDITLLEDGHYVVVWDDRFKGVFAQLFDQEGAPINGPRRVDDDATYKDYVGDNSFKTGANRANPQATLLSNGDFVVLWAPTNDGDVFNKGLYAQRFNSVGDPVGGTIVVNYPSSSIYSGTVVNKLAYAAAGPDGSFDVNWYLKDFGNATQHFDKLNNPVGPIQHAQSTVDSDQAYGLDGGHVQVTKTGLPQSWPLGQHTGIVAQFFNSAGSPQGAAIRLDTAEEWDGDKPSIVALSDGTYIVAWTAFDQHIIPMLDANGFAKYDPISLLPVAEPRVSHLLTQRLSADGAKLGSLNEIPFTFNSNKIQYHQNLEPTPNGYLLSWVEDGPLTVDSIQYFDFGGSPMGSRITTPLPDISSYEWAYSDVLDDLLPQLLGAQSKLPNIEIVALNNGTYALAYSSWLADGYFQYADGRTQNIFVDRFTLDPPAIAMAGRGAMEAIYARENTTVVATVSIIPLDGVSGLPLFSVVGGADADKFQIDAIGGTLSFKVAPNFEAPTDSDHNNSYVVQLRATLGSQVALETLTVNVINANDAPRIAASNVDGTSSYSITENSTVVATLAATDADPRSALSYSIVGGTDAGSFQINASSGVLSFKAAHDFEAPTDSDHNNSYVVQVRVSDGIATTHEIITVNVTNVSEAPVIVSNGGATAATLAMAENTKSVGSVTATDPDAGTTLTYSIAGGADGGKFTINGSTGALSFLAAPDYEHPSDADHNNSYVVQVRASDGSLADDQTITVNVTDVAETVRWLQSVDLGPHPAGWSPAGNGDFNKDGTSDLAWINNSTGETELWLLADGHWSASIVLGTHNTAWRPAGTGDFNADGTSDVAWFNPTNGDMEIWKTANGKWAGSVDYGPHNTAWQPVGIGDFNADGTGDVLWHNPTTGDAEIWKTSNGQWAGSVDYGPHDTAWRPAGVGDFNNDGTSDILWYNPTTGDAEIWKTKNGQWAGSVDLGTHPLGWQPVGVADFNGDGNSDIVWYNPTNGNVEIWKTANGAWAGSIDVGNHPAGTEIVGLGDVNHDGTPDILFRDPATTHVEAWLLSNS